MANIGYILAADKINGHTVHATFPPKSSDTLDEIDTLTNCWFRCSNFTSKRVSVCELKNKYYEPTDDDECSSELHSIQLAGLKYINPHWCFGRVQYHSENANLLDKINAIKDYDLVLVMKHNLQDVSLNIPRSDGSIQTAKVEDDNPLRKMNFKGSNMLHLAIKMQFFCERRDDMLEKIIPLCGFTNDDGKKISGLTDVNPDVFGNSFVLKLGYSVINEPYYVDKRENWKNTISEYLNTFNIKHEFYVYEKNT